MLSFCDAGLENDERFIGDGRSRKEERHIGVFLIQQPSDARGLGIQLDITNQVEDST